MFIAYERSDKIILKRSKQIPVIIAGLFGAVFFIWLIYTNVNILLSPLYNADSEIHFFSVLWSSTCVSISYFALRLCLYLSFSSYIVEIGKAKSLVKINKRDFLKVIETNLERKQLARIEIRDPSSELRKKLGPEVRNSSYTFYDLNLIPIDTRISGYRIFASNDLDLLKTLGEKIAAIMNLRLEIKASKSTDDLPAPENPIPTNGPVLNAIFEEKCEFRDLYYKFYRAVAEEDDKIILVPLGSTKVDGPTDPGIDGWHMPITNSSSLNKKKVIIDKHSFKDASGKSYSRWDGGKRPCRFV